MHYEIRYSLDDPRLADACALRDWREYVGEEMWARIAQLVDEADGLRGKFQVVRLAALMQGVQGRPVRAYQRALLAMGRRAR